MTPAPDQRDPAFENRATRIAAERIDVEWFNDFCSERADRGEIDYGTSFPAADRDLAREVLEELADARNYIVWQLDRLARGLDAFEPQRSRALWGALRHLVVAADLVHGIEG